MGESQFTEYNVVCGPFTGFYWSTGVWNWRNTWVNWNSQNWEIAGTPSQSLVSFSQLGISKIHFISKAITTVNKSI